MNKTISAFLITALAISMLPAVMAADTQQNTLPPGEETQIQQEVQIMNNELGAQIRLLQLEKTIDIHIAIGNRVIEKAQELNKNATDLEATIAQMQDLKTEVQQAEPTADNAIQQFVDLKKEAISLTKQFRDTARTLFTPEEIQQLRQEQEQIKEQKEQKGQEAQEIRQKIKEYNQQKLEQLKTQLGLNIQNIADEMKQGNITTEQAKQMIKEKIMKLTPAKIKKIYNKAKEEEIKQKAKAKEEVSEVMKEFEARYKQRLQKRLNQTMSNISKQVKEQMKQQIKKQINKTLQETASGEIENLTNNASNATQAINNITNKIMGGH